MFRHTKSFLIASNQFARSFRNQKDDYTDREATMRKICILILILPTIIFAEHDLRQIEKYCEVSEYDDYGEIDC